MKLLNCPMNGVRPLNEFVFGGELREMPNPDKSTDLEWASYVHYRDNAPGIKKEWWFHAPSGTWFIAERNTLSDEVLATYLYGKPPTVAKASVKKAAAPKKAAIAKNSSVKEVAKKATAKKVTTKNISKKLSKEQS